MTKKNSLRRKLIADWKATKLEVKNPGQVEFEEAKAKSNIERKYYKKKRRNLRALLEDFETEWYWSEFDLKRFDHMWNAGYPVSEICRLLPAKPHEVGLMIIDADMRGAIKARPGGPLGAEDPALRTEPIGEEEFYAKKSKFKKGNG